MSRTFYVNGDFVNEEDAKISVLDRGFLFADAVYEVSTVLDGKLIDNSAHLVRLHRSLNELNMSAPMPDNEIETIQKRLIEYNELDQGGLYLQISRGAADRDFRLPGGINAVQPGDVYTSQEPAGRSLCQIRPQGDFGGRSALETPRH